MTTYRVNIEERKTVTLWVDAETEIEAMATAEELYDPSDVDDADLDSTAKAIEPAEGDLVWVGGGGGRWVTWA